MKQNSETFTNRRSSKAQAASFPKSPTALYRYPLFGGSFAYACPPLIRSTAGGASNSATSAISANRFRFFIRCRSDHCQLNLAPSPGRERHQHIEAKFLPLAAHQIRHPRLTNMQMLGSLLLSPSTFRNGCPQPDHQIGPQLEQHGLFVIERRRCRSIPLPAPYHPPICL